MRQPEYHSGDYDTTYLDRLLATRRESFSELEPRDEDLAAIATAFDAYFRATAAAAGGQGLPNRRSMWKQSARREALRG